MTTAAVAQPPVSPRPPRPPPARFSCAAALLLAAISACASAPEQGWLTWRAQAIAQFEESAEPDPVAARLLGGFADWRLQPPIARGDQLLYRLDVLGPDATEVRYLLFRVRTTKFAGDLDGKGGTLTIEPKMACTLTLTTPTGPIETRHESRGWNMDLVVFDARGQEVGQSTAFAPVDFLATGFYVDPATHDATDVAQTRSDSLALIACTQLLQNDKTLLDLAQDLSGFGVLDAVLGLGVRIQIRFDPTERVPAPGRLGLRGQWLPFELAINDTPCLRLVARVVPPRGPLGLAAGIMDAAGFRASDARHRFRLRLVGARRGDGQPATRPGRRP